MNILTLKDKLALVTGASSGIGLAIAGKLASEGCDLILVARGEPRLRQIAKILLSRYRVKVWWYVADITKAQDIKRLKKEVKKDVGGIDILVNNAGGSHPTLSDDEFDMAFTQDVELNLLSAHLSCRLLSPLIRSGGSIVNMSSLSGQGMITPIPTKHSIKMGYAVAKAGVIQLTKLYASQLSERGIRVNVVAPGSIYPTGMTESWDKGKQKDLVKQIPLKRLGRPQDVANAVYFLVSDLASFITGHTLNLNGGQRI